MFVVETHVGPSRIHGTGVFASAAIAAGDVVWRFHQQFDRVLKQEDMSGLPEPTLAFLRIYAYRSGDLGGALVLSGDHARFLNHSDDPNTEEKPFISIARRDIAAGEEITCNYGAFCTDWNGSFKETDIGHADMEERRGK